MSAADSEITALATSIDGFIERQHAAVESPYATNLIASRIRVLKLIYPAVTAQIGDAAMTALSQAYARHYASRHWDINLYGDEFAELLAAQYQGTQPERFNWQELGALAQLEHQLCTLYYADTLPTEQLQDAGLEDATAAVEIHLTDIRPSLLEDLARHHPLLDPITPELHNIPCLLLRCNFRFVVIAVPEQEVAV